MQLFLGGKKIGKLLIKNEFSLYKTYVIAN